MTDRLNPDWWEILRGSRFRCTQCGRCCEQPGHVYFNREEVEPIAVQVLPVDLILYQHVFALS